MYVADIKFLTPENLSQVLEINSQILNPWSDDIIEDDLNNNSIDEVSYIGAFATTLEAPLLGYAVLGCEHGVKKCGVLMALIVHRDYFRMGIGTQLIFAVSDCAEYLRYKRIKLRVRKSNFAAIALYEKFSFRKESIISGYYSNGEDAFVMSSKIPVQVQV